MQPALLHVYMSAFLENMFHRSPDTFRYSHWCLFYKRLAPIENDFLEQDVINQHQAQIVKLVMSKGGFVFVCGDANNMAKDVMNAFTVAIQTVQGIEEEKAKEIVLQLQKDRRYLQDIWTWFISLLFLSIMYSVYYIKFEENYSTHRWLI